MPTRPLVTSHRGDLRRLRGRWDRIALVVGVATAIGFPLLASERWLDVGNQALIHIVGATEGDEFNAFACVNGEVVG